MSDRNQISQVSFEENERIALSHAIETILGSEDKENGTISQTNLRTSMSSLEYSNIEKTPHSGTLDKSSFRQHCRKLDDRDTTPKKRNEPKRHLNSVNILCRSKRRKLEKMRESGSSSHKERMNRILHSTPNVRQYGPLQPIPDANIHVIDPLGSGDSGVMVKDASGNLHPAEFVPVMVEERNGGFFMSPNNISNVSRTKGSSHESKGQDDSLTNITWLKKMSAPGVSPRVDSGKQNRSQSADPLCERPPYSYSALIQFALISTPVGKMTLKEIYEWIQTNFPFFKTAKLGWKNSIRHNLSLHKIFIREAPDGPGKPAFWTLRPGTVVRLPENRLFVMEGKSGGGCLPGISSSQYSLHGMSGGRACIKQADGTTQMISEHLITAAPKPKPILPRVSQSYAFVSMPLLSSAGLCGLSDDSSNSRKRFQRIAPKQGPMTQRFYFPSTYDSGIDLCSLETPTRKSSHTSKEASAPVEKVRVDPDSVPKCNPIMSTPLKPSKSSNGMEPSSSLMESMGTFTPLKDIDDDLLRAGNLLNITPIKESGMTPIIKGVLSQSSNLELSPVPSGKPRQPSISTPVVVERNEMSFDFEELFSAADSADGIDLGNYSFGNLFSPVSKK
ncbi:Forkhead box protein M1 [Holothuria leucospilota]|uniref:Forkhead box protein M1 n=1 Tax=Holothuria leucospilota TaxID=206669 RepID=A0A9Q1BFJ2_HOLLE|nr:Forkhead box protein M1 [Holothuria leucospilota]